MESYKEVIESNPKVEFVHISRDRDDSAATSWATDVGFPWLTVLPRDAERSGLLEYRTANSVPHYVLVDSDGNTVANGSSAAFAKIRETASTAED